MKQLAACLGRGHSSAVRDAAAPRFPALLAGCCCCRCRARAAPGNPAHPRSILARLPAHIRVRTQQWLLALRCAVGFALGGTPIAVTIFAEFVPSSGRGAWLLLMQGFWTVG